MSSGTRLSDLRVLIADRLLERQPIDAITLMQAALAEFPDAKPEDVVLGFDGLADARSPSDKTSLPTSITTEHKISPQPMAGGPNRVVTERRPAAA